MLKISSKWTLSRICLCKEILHILITKTHQTYFGKNLTNSEQFATFLSNKNKLLLNRVCTSSSARSSKKETSCNMEVLLSTHIPLQHRIILSPQLALSTNNSQLISKVLPKASLSSQHRAVKKTLIGAFQTRRCL